MVMIPGNEPRSYEARAQETERRLNNEREQAAAEHAVHDGEVRRLSLMERLRKLLRR